MHVLGATRVLGYERAAFHACGETTLDWPVSIDTLPRRRRPETCEMIVLSYCVLTVQLWILYSVALLIGIGGTMRGCSNR